MESMIASSCTIRHSLFLLNCSISNKNLLSSSSPSSNAGFRHFTSSCGSHRCRSSSSTSSPPPSPSPSSSLRSPAFSLRNISPFSPPPPPPSSILCRSASSNDITATQSSSIDNNKELNEGIAGFYDASSGLWEDMWGEHMHHGFYDPDLPLFAALSADHRAAQIRMIEESLRWASIPDQGEGQPKKIVDVGCGIGGSSRYLARKYGAEVVGITLSPKQAQRATEISASAGLSDKVRFQVADALNQPFPDEAFDLVWSMESGEHMPDKKKFLAELARVTKPGGHIIIVTWCHRELLQNEKELKADEKELLDKLCDMYYLPAWCPTSKYVNLAQSMGLKDVRSADWSQHVTPFWPAVIVSALSIKGLVGLATSGSTTFRGALAMAYMVQGYNSGLIKFPIITARKGDSTVVY